MQKINILTLKLALLVLFLSACSPTLNIEQIENATENQPIHFNASIDPNGVSIQSRELFLKKHYPEDTEFNEVENTNPSSDNINVTLPGLAYGQYETKLRVKHNGRVYAPNSVTTSTSETFFVHPEFPEGCFLFNQSTESWTAQGPFADSTLIGNADICPLLSIANASWPFAPTTPITGSLMVSLSSACIPPEHQSTPWSVFITSPQIHNDENWQNITGLRFHASSNRPLNVRAIIISEDENGDLIRLPQGNELELPSTQFIWTDFSVDVSLEEAQAINQIMFRFSGYPENSTIGDNQIRIDAICPMKN